MELSVSFCQRVPASMSDNKRNKRKTQLVCKAGFRYSLRWRAFTDI